MKTLASAVLALSVLVPSSRAASIAQDFMSKAQKAQNAINSSKLNTALKQEFSARLAKIEADTCGAAAGQSAAHIECVNPTASKIEAGGDAIDKLTDDLADAVKNDAGQSMADLYAPKVEALRAKIAKATIDAADRQNLADHIHAFNLSLADKSIKAEKIDAAFQKLSDDVDAALQLAADKSGAKNFGTEFANKVAALDKKITTSKLNKDFTADFDAKLRAISQKHCPAGNLVGRAEGLAPAAGADPCPKASASSLEQGIDDVTALSDAVDQAIKDDGSKKLGDIYAPKLDALRKKITAAKMDKADAKALIARVDTFASTVGAVKTGKPWDASGFFKTPRKYPKGEDAVSLAEEGYTELSDDVDAAVKLAADKADANGFLPGLQSKIEAIKKKLDGSKLTGPVQDDFHQRLSAIVKNVCAGPLLSRASFKRGQEDLSACKGAKPSDIEKAGDDVAALSDAVDQAVKDDGTKNLTELYGPKLDALKKQLDGSKALDVDKRPLLGRLDALRRELTASSLAKNTAVTGSKAKTAADLLQDVSDKYDALAADVKALLDLTGKKN